jgi:hypothetical protein
MFKLVLLKEFTIDVMLIFDNLNFYKYQYNIYRYICILKDTHK